MRNMYIVFTHVTSDEIDVHNNDIPFIILISELIENYNHASSHMLPTIAENNELNCSVCCYCIGDGRSRSLMKF